MLRISKLIPLPGRASFARVEIPAILPESAPAVVVDTERVNDSDFTSLIAPVRLFDFVYRNLQPQLHPKFLCLPVVLH